eukprot:124469-Chlamydomonas_euryale.AAC.1
MSASASVYTLTPPNLLGVLASIVSHRGGSGFPKLPSGGLAPASADYTKLLLVDFVRSQAGTCHWHV